MEDGWYEVERKGLERRVLVVFGRVAVWTTDLVAGVFPHVSLGEPWVACAKELRAAGCKIRRMDP